MTNCRELRLVLVPLVCVLQSACGDSKTPVTWWDAGTPDASANSDAGQTSSNPESSSAADAGATCAQIESACAGNDDVDGLGNLCLRVSSEGDTATCDAVVHECLPYCAAGADAAVEHGHLDAEDCEAMGDTCHDFDTGSGLGHWCHEVGHSGNVAWCGAIYDECAALCGEPEGHEHEHDEDAGEHVELTLNFAAKFGTEEFACGGAYADVGTAHTTVTPLDLRFYVSNIRLLTDEGEQVPVVIDDMSPYQGGGVALLDFADGRGACQNDTTTNTTVHVSAPNGHYTGIAFSASVPEELNHEDPLTLPAPLQATDMMWGWVAGYKFLKLELQAVASSSDGPDASDTVAVSTSVDSSAPSDAGEDAGQLDDAGGALGMSFLDAGIETPTEPGSSAEMPSVAFLHMGSVACSEASSDAGGEEFGEISCAKANRNEVVFAAFDIAENVVVFDVAAVVAQADLSESVMCHPQGPRCASLFEAIGVDYQTGADLETHAAFRVE